MTKISQLIRLGNKHKQPKYNSFSMYADTTSSTIFPNTAQEDSSQEIDYSQEIIESYPNNHFKKKKTLKVLKKLLVCGMGSKQSHPNKSRSPIMISPGL